jgi:hypothetical protein
MAFRISSCLKTAAACCSLALVSYAMFADVERFRYRDDPARRRSVHDPGPSGYGCAKHE